VFFVKQKKAIIWKCEIWLFVQVCECFDVLEAQTFVLSNPRGHFAETVNLAKICLCCCVAQPLEYYTPASVNFFHAQKNPWAMVFPNEYTHVFKNLIMCRRSSVVVMIP